MNVKDIINRIGYFRNKANLSAKALSLSIDKSSAYITKMEHGEYEPSARVILDICEACGITAEEFYYENIDSYKTDKELLTLLKQADEKKKLAVKQILLELLK
ncbi:MAG: helix-turn-helix transcriptional regulator [Clostridiales bacterium]|nr:helix-turn-helix transcriptional regulator [Clostridiales bacterium]